jgi:uncharacterized protein (TIGR02594 family)
MPAFEELHDHYAKLWDAAKIREERKPEIATQVQNLLGLKADYQKVETACGVPWYVVGLIHYREASFRETRHLHNGDPLTGRTFQEPPGHPVAGTPPFTWVESAIDALTIEGFRKVANWTVERIAYQLELYNGWGYHTRNINSPYLWSFTDQYTTGYFVGDHDFRPGEVNKQAGTMALLKQLVANNDVNITRESGVPARPRPPPVPVPTGLFLVDGDPFGLRKDPDQNSQRILRVLDDMPIRKLKEIDHIWWQVEVTAPDKSKSVGFAKREWLKDMTVLSNFEDDLFAEACLSEARAQGTNAHFLIALAQAESGLTNNVIAGEGPRFGLFALTETEFTANNNPAVTGFGDADRFNPDAQVPAAAALVVKLTGELQTELPDKRLPTSEEIYLARIFGAKGAKTLLAAANQGGRVRDALAPPLFASADLDRIFATRPSLLAADITIQALRTAMQSKLDEGFKIAVDQILAVEPDLAIGPAEAIDGSTVPWMGPARAELAKNIKEFKGPGASNPEIEKYFTATPLGRQPDDVAWCAAFVSWCIKQVGGSQKHVTYSARAADWLNNGDKLAGPQYGAIAVTRPYAKTSSGHVGFVVAWDGARVKFLGGNQGDAVCEKDFPIGDIRGWRMV